MSPPSQVPVHHEESFPRVSGDEPTVEDTPRRGGEFSPRERG